MSPSELKYQVESRGTESHFFSRRTMKFFGDSMRNYGVRSVTITANYDTEGNYHKQGVTVECWELYRKQPVKNGLQISTFFRKDDYTITHPKV
jgi:hypothetical protein